MIDRVAFARVMGGFADRIGRALAPETAEMYYDTLSDALTTDEFLAGARIVFRTHGYNTWPAPQQFVDAAKPQSPALLGAAEAFEKVLEIANQAQRPWPDRHADILALGPVVERAFRAAGGRREMANILETDVPFARRRFVDVYEQASEYEAKAFTAASALANVTAAPRLNEMHDAAAMVVRGIAQLKAAPLSGRDRAAGAHHEAADD